MDMKSEKGQLGVCMIISSFYPLIGGAERQAEQLASRLIERGIEVCVLTRRYEGLKGYGRINGVPVHRIFTSNKGPIIASLSYTLLSLLWLYKNGRKYPILHCHTALSPATIGAIARILLHKKVICKIACSGTYGDVAQIQQLPLAGLRKRLLHWIDAFVVLNDEARKELETLGLTNVLTEKIPNGVDTDLFQPASPEERSALRERLGLAQKRNLVLFAGKLTPQKGLDTLLHAWAQLWLSERLPSPRVGRGAGGEGQERAQLLILGEGSQRVSLDRLAKRLGIADTVSFLGKQENILEYFKAADIFVLPSLAEGMSNSLLEAMSCGLAVIAADNAGNREVINSPDSGIIVEPQNPHQLAEALEMLLNNRELVARLGQQARCVVKERFSLTDVVEQYEQLYKRLLAEK